MVFIRSRYENLFCDVINRELLFFFLRITVESVLTPVRYKDHTEIYRSNVNKRRIWYKTCDDTVATTSAVPCTRFPEV